MTAALFVKLVLVNLAIELELDSTTPDLSKTIDIESKVLSEKLTVALSEILSRD